MLLCWTKVPARRPAFSTLHTDFIDFDTACQQYDYSPYTVMEEQKLTNEPAVCNSTPRTPRHKQRKTHNRT